MQKNINKIILAVIISVALAFAVATGIILLLKFNNPPVLQSSYFSDILPTYTSTTSESEEKLIMTYPSENNITVIDPSFTFTGNSNVNIPLSVNGQIIDLSENGSFSYSTELKIGKNTFDFLYNGITYTYTVNYRYVVIQDYSPSLAQSYSSGTQFVVSVTARNKSNVTASFGGKTINLTANEDSKAKSEDAFVVFSGTFRLPSDNYTDIAYNPIVFTATYKGITETFKSGKITCKKSNLVKDNDASATPKGGQYLNVGSGKITEIIHYNAETFAPYSTNDWSNPTYNYLPKGTVDYSSTEYVYHKSNGETKKYAVLRCGRQVYVSRKDKPHTEDIPVVKEYIGTLPDHNELEIASFENNGNHTVLTLNTMWKAPFYFDLAQQTYTNPPRQDFSVNQAEFTYIDITFCYGTVLNGEIANLQNNPLFSSAQIINNYGDNGVIRDITLRLTLKNKGAFYGWDASYNSDGQLVFEFLNPKKASPSDNSYKADLTGIKILIDVGHGGKDTGALGANGVSHSEAKQNLLLSKIIASELLKTGATVYLTRSDDTTSSTDDRTKILKSLKPDLCIAIHHNCSDASYPNGFDSLYFTPFSQKAASIIYKNTTATGLYQKYNIGWHYYYTARVTNCPVVLTENGYMSNRNDYQNILSEESNIKKAKSIVNGIVEYFLNIK